MRKPVVEVIEWDGSVWRRYPESKRRHLRVYYAGYWKGKLTCLHRALWEYHNGPIPGDYEIHHKDQNPLNNDIDNLECLSHGDHLRKEAELGSFSTEKIKKHLDEVRHLASEWHRSEEGRKWHAANSRQAMAKRKMRELICKQCSSGFKSKHPYAMYCSKKCAGRSRGIVKQNKIHSIVCGACGQKFLAPRKDRKYCGKRCSGIASHNPLHLH